MANDTHKKFLRLAGFEENEIPEYLADGCKASERLGLKVEDVAYATEDYYAW